MNVQEILDFVNFEVNKHQSGNSLNKEEFNLCLQVANIEYFKWYYGLPEEYQPGRPIARVSHETTNKISDGLRIFKKRMGGKNPKMQVDSGGFADIPTDYVHQSSIRYFNTKKNKSRMVEVLTDAQLDDRLGDAVRDPDLDCPVCCLYDDHIQFWPANLGSVDFTYLRLPATPIYEATIVNDDFVYDAVNSVQLEWPEVNHPDIAQFILEYVAVNLREGMVYQNTLRRKAQGK